MIKRMVASPNPIHRSLLWLSSTDISWLWPSISISSFLRLSANLNAFIILSVQLLDGGTVRESNVRISMSLENDKVLKELSELDLFLMTTLLTSSILKSICFCKSTSSVVVNDVNSAKCISGNDQWSCKVGIQYLLFFKRCRRLVEHRNFQSLGYKA